jgi:hypothetical protein
VHGGNTHSRLGRVVGCRSLQAQRRNPRLLQPLHDRIDIVVRPSCDANLTRFDGVVGKLLQQELPDAIRKRVERFGASPASLQREQDGNSGFGLVAQARRPGDQVP